MKKKYIFIGLAMAAILSICAGAMQTEGNPILNLLESQAPQQMQEETLLPEAETEKVKSQVIAQTKEVVTKTDLRALLQQQGYYVDEINQGMSSLIRLAALYQLSDAQIGEITTLVQEGYYLAPLMEIFEFTLDTQYPEDFTFIKSLYDCASSMGYLGERHWVEDAFNSVTNYQHGVLSEEEIAYYVAQGITTEDISAANAMSRKGILTIKQILDQRVSGAQWADIGAQIYEKEGASAQSLSACESLYDVYDCAVLASVAELSVDEVAQNRAQAEQILGQKQIAGYALLDELQVYTGVTDEVLEEAEQKIPAVPKEEIETYLKEGYTIRQIQEGQSEAAANGAALEDVLE